MAEYSVGLARIVGAVYDNKGKDCFHVRLDTERGRLDYIVSGENELRFLSTFNVSSYRRLQGKKVFTLCVDDYIEILVPFSNPQIQSSH